MRKVKLNMCEYSTKTMDVHARYRANCVRRTNIIRELEKLRRDVEHDANTLHDTNTLCNLIDTSYKIQDSVLISISHKICSARAGEPKLFTAVKKFIGTWRDPRLDVYHAHRKDVVDRLNYLLMPDEIDQILKFV